MSKRKILRRMERPNRKARQSAASTQPTKKDNGFEIFISNKDLPQFIIAAQIASENDRKDETAALLNDGNIEIVRQMLDKNPDRWDVMFLLGWLFNEIGHFEKAEYWHKKVLNHGFHPVVLPELAEICKRTQRFCQATRYYRKALDVQPANNWLRTSLAISLIRQGKTAEGIELLQQAVKQTPNDAKRRSKLLFHLHYLSNQNKTALFEEHKRWGQLHAPANRTEKSHSNTPEPDRKLKVGYISADFRMHSVMYFFEPLLDSHDRRTVEVYGYGNLKYPDRLTERLKAKFNHYRDIYKLEDRKAADVIADDRIDILVDLVGHTADNRLPMLAYKPAPIQVTYLGYPNTTGMRQIDYRLTDELADTPQLQRFYTEELVFLPNGFLCYRPKDSAPYVAPPPVAKKGFVTFASFNNNCKINPFIVELWAGILKANANARLLLKFKGGGVQEMADHYLQQFEKCGLDRARVEICGWQSADDYLKLYEQVDIALDTYPYNGTTTTCEALWMGVPVISLVGDSHYSRVGLSILSGVGLEFCAASTPKEYIAKATVLAAKSDALAQIRASMRDRLKESTLLDEKAFAQDVEQAYRKMWHRWCQYRGVNLDNQKVPLAAK